MFLSSAEHRIILKNVGNQSVGKSMPTIRSLVNIIFFGMCDINNVEQSLNTRGRQALLKSQSL